MTLQWPPCEGHKQIHATPPLWAPTTGATPSYAQAHTQQPESYTAWK
eukprot:CAMPEP_0197896758 /NCGR_PEP_ID=MMETSP1439-20131203/40724_1 /TAXON_ID=66791 /ORGANISM="Gonyaulax spinifera, Strain CCMP409" /LENGTH=46 /DNA_ID= /DNA_START= /DNA_END= /DNA_ORIENTATION=